MVAIAHPVGSTQISPCHEHGMQLVRGRNAGRLEATAQHVCEVYFSTDKSDDRERHWCFQRSFEPLQPLSEQHIIIMAESARLKGSEKAMDG